MRRPQVKVYAGFFPADETCLLPLKEAGGQAIGNEDWLFLEGDLLRISWEGVCFPLEAALEALAACLPPAAQGKLDYLDLEAWTLTRCVLEPGGGPGGRFKSSTRGLNQVLEYSGH